MLSTPCSWSLRLKFSILSFYQHTLLLTSKGEVLACGDNQEGQCGQGEMKSKTIGGKVGLDR